MKTVYSAIQPSGELTIGNYLGAIKNFRAFESQYNTIFCVADMHAITVRQEPKDLRLRTQKLIAFYLASGLDPEKSIIYVQSHVKAHAELAWILNCYCYMGEMGRMTQFKDKSKNLGQSVSVGLFSYPVLMAADILLYQTDLVPVGDDQSQHLEIARDIAGRFNQAYSETFKIPEIYLNKFGARIYDLQEPTKKMSKSAEGSGTILLEDSNDVIRKKISRAVTDNFAKVNYSDEQPGIKNLINIYALVKNIEIESAVKDLENLNYRDLKEAVSQAVIEELEPFREKYFTILKDKDLIEKVYRDGAMKASYIARKTLDKVKRKVGFLKE